MPYGTEIEKALDELIADEAGMKFQGLAVILAKREWSRLVASERHRDLGLDAHANGDLEPDGKGMGPSVLVDRGVRQDRKGRNEGEENYPDVPCSRVRYWVGHPATPWRPACRITWEVRSARFL